VAIEASNLRQLTTISVRISRVTEKSHLFHDIVVAKICQWTSCAGRYSSFCWGQKC